MRNTPWTRWTQRALVAGIALWLAGCAGPSRDEEETARAILEQQTPSTPTTPSVDPDAIAPLPPPTLGSVPAASALRAGRGVATFANARWEDLPTWVIEDEALAWDAFLRNCQAIMARGRAQAGSGAAVAAARPWRDVCVAAFASDSGVNPAQPGSVRAFMQRWLQPWVVTSDGQPARGTLTGYYEPLVRAARERHGPYQWPLYALPDDLLVIDLGSVYPALAGQRVRGKLVDGRRVVPYDTRAELDRNGRTPPAVVWVDDPVDAFFLQVQGSGRALLKDGPHEGRMLRLAYADQNGHPYVSIGRWLVEQGEMTLAQASAQNIREWARRNPSRVRELLHVNPSVVFFREEWVSPAGEGPKGAFGVPLAGRHAIAVDPQFVPLGSPVVLSSTLPGSNAPFNRWALAQDTGSAIKGAARADFFFGFGDEAGEQAGRMKQPNRMWVLWPRGQGRPAVDG